MAEEDSFADEEPFGDILDQDSDIKLKSIMNLNEENLRIYSEDNGWKILQEHFMDISID